MGDKAGAKKAMADANVEFKAGSKVGLVGPSGGGKSTLLSLVQRFYDPEKGTILLDDRPLREYAPDFLAEQFRVVEHFFNAKRLFVYLILDVCFLHVFVNVVTNIFVN